MSEFGSNLIEIINTILDKRLDDIKFDKTFKSTVWAVNSDGTYKINYLGQQYDVYNALDTELKPGQSVWIKIPCGIMKNMHICGITNDKEHWNKQADWNEADTNSGAYIKNKPTSLKNPQALTFTGGSSESYDGSAAKSVNIPTALPTPNSLTFTGGETGSWNGSSNKTVHIPTTLPANGGNSDTVDGKHADELLDYNNHTNKPTSLKNPQALSFTGSVTETYDGSEAKTVEIPTVLKNPKALTFTGGETGSYDGSQAKSIAIPTLPSSLPANGGDADTVDGKHASELQDYNNLTNRPTIPAAVRVKGNAENTYHTGDVNLTPANIGALAADGTAINSVEWNTYKIQFLSQNEFDSMTNRDPKTVYFIL